MRRFGEEGGLLTYGSYLRLPELLGQQRPQVEPPVHDELLFITVHQAYEMWFKQLLHELTAVRDAMLAGTAQAWRAGQLLKRAHVSERLRLAVEELLQAEDLRDLGDLRLALGFGTPLSLSAKPMFSATLMCGYS